MIIVSGHGVNPPYLAVAANEVNVRTGALCASLYWSAVVEGVDEILTSEAPGGTGHACELETSVMLALDPERVQQEKIVDDLGFQQGHFLQMDLRSSTGVHLGRALVEQLLQLPAWPACPAWPPSKKAKHCSIGQARGCWRWLVSCGPVLTRQIPGAISTERPPKSALTSTANESSFHNRLFPSLVQARRER